MKSAEKNVYAEARQAHSKVYQGLLDVKTELSQMTAATDLVDVIYALRESSKLVDDLRKEINAQVEFAEKLCCAAWIRDNTGEPIRSQHCTGSPDVKMVPKIPKPGTPEYSALLEYFKVPEDVPFKPHWPKMLERVSEDLANGKPMPAGCNVHDTWTIFRVSTRKKLPILDEKEDALTSAGLLKKREELLYHLRYLDTAMLGRLCSAAQLLRTLSLEQTVADQEQPVAADSGGSDEEKMF